MKYAPIPLRPFNQHKQYDRFFTVTHDCSKNTRMKIADRFKQYEVRGAHFADDYKADGPVVLKTGVYFDDMAELREHFEGQGKYTVIYDDEEGET